LLSNALYQEAEKLYQKFVHTIAFLLSVALDWLPPPQKTSFMHSSLFYLHAKVGGSNSANHNYSPTFGILARVAIAILWAKILPYRDRCFPYVIQFDLSVKSYF
jgi:hypothetical protein